MGNSHSSSKFQSADLDSSYTISKPTNPDISRRASARPGSRRARDDSAAARGSGTHNTLGVPSTGHRRSRSATPAVSRSHEPAPPPPYSAAAPAQPSVPNSSGTARINQNSSAAAGPTATGSRFTSVFSVPPVNATSSSASTATSNRRNIRSISYLRAPLRQESVENALETLRKYNTVIIVDDSTSMVGERWSEAREALASLAGTAGKYDTDGIDVYFLNDSKVGRNMKNDSDVQGLFNSVRPRGATPIGGKLEELLLDYLSQIESAKESQDPAVFKAIKPVNYIILTDGAPTDDPESVIVSAARRLDARNFPISQVGIQFVQIGNSSGATEYLQELDDGLSQNYGIRDIVDTTPYTGGLLTAEILTKILLGGINRRVDRKGGDSVM